MTALHDAIDDIRFDKRIARLAAKDADAKRRALDAVERRERKIEVERRREYGLRRDGRVDWNALADMYGQ